MAVSKIARDGAPLDEPVSPHPKTPQPRRSLLLGLVAAISTTAALILAVLYFRQAPATEPMVRFVVAPPENVTLDEPSLSPDGERLAFFGREPDGLQRLWIRPLASLTAEPVPGAEGGNSAF